MIRFYASCGAVVVGLLMVGWAQAATHHSKHHFGPHGKPHRPLPPRQPLQKGLPPTSGTSHSNGGTNGPNSAANIPNTPTYDTNNATYDPNSGSNQPVGEPVSGNDAQQEVSPQGDGQRWRHKYRHRFPWFPRRGFHR
jgi:hypothetical protein